VQGEQLRKTEMNRCHGSAWTRRKWSGHEEQVILAKAKAEAEVSINRAKDSSI
jgi:hypothetical protein